MAESDQATEQEDQQADATGGDSAEGKTQQREERDAPAGGSDESSEGGGGEGEDQSEEHQKAQEKEEETQAAREKIKELEDDPPQDLEDWPDDAAKYETFGGPEGEHSYDEGPEVKLGPSSLRHHEDGSVEIEGEEVEDADKYKGEPIPGGPTDPDASLDLTTKKIREKQGRDLESEDEDGDGDDSESEDSESDDSGSEAESEQSS